MAHKVLVRTREKTTTTGTGAITVSGLVSTDNVLFSSGMSIGDTAFMCVVSGDGIAWEEFLGTYSSANTITRTTTIINNSGTTANISLSGTSRVFGIIPSDFSALFDKLFGASNEQVVKRSSGSWSSDFVGGKSWKKFVDAATTAALAANTYANGSSGVGATLTANSNGSLTIDGIAIQVGHRILVKDEVTTSHNGIYVMTQFGDGSHPYILTRAEDHNQVANMYEGDTVIVGHAGSANKDTVWAMNIDSAPVVLGTTLFTFNQAVGTGFVAGWHYPVAFATTGTLAANTYSNGSSGVGATLTGNSNGALASQDGITPVVGYRLLVKDEAATANNGIYVVTQVGDGSHPYILTRATDFNSPNNINQGDVVAVGPNGTTNARQFFQVTASGSPIVVGTIGFTFDSFTPVFVGDSGSGGTKGFVPAPAAGDAAAGKFLKADGTFDVPSGSSGAYGSASSVDASNSSGTIQLTGIGAFDSAEILIQGLVPATHNATCTMQFGSSTGPTWETGNNYADTWYLVGEGGFTSAGGTTTDSKLSFAGIQLRALADSNGNFSGFSARLFISRNSNKTYQLIGVLSMSGGDGHYYTVQWEGMFYNNVDITAVRIQTSSGNWNIGKLSFIPITV